MKSSVVFLLLLMSLSPIFAQQKVEKGGERVNSYAQTDEFILAEVLLENGKMEKVPVEFSVSLTNMAKGDVDLVTSWSSILMINSRAKFSCTNKSTYIPASIFIYKTETGTITGQIKGLARNSFGAEGDVSLMFSFDNGELKF